MSLVAPARPLFPLAPEPSRLIFPSMPVTSTLAAQLRRLSAREKAALADHLWREAEVKLAPSAAQLAELDRREASALRRPQRLRSVGDAVRRLRR